MLTKLRFRAWDRPGARCENCSSQGSLIADMYISTIGR